MSGFLPYFKPLYPAVTYRCQLCGKELSKDDFYSTPARTAEARLAGGGDYMFCSGCAPHLDQITQRLGAEAARLDAEHEKNKQARLKALAEGYMEDLREKAPGAQPVPSQSDTAPPPPNRSLRRRGPMSIQVPS